MLSHPLFGTLKNLTGNARGCVYTEPLWGIPFNLYAPYVSVYMLALGLTDSQVGLIASLGLSFSIFSSLMSGAITDKLGRKRATFIFDMLSWSVPTLIWAVSQNFWYFVAAAVVNSLWRITMNSWTCLMVEDTDPGLLVDVYTWIYISNLVAAFFAPIAGLLIGTFSLVPTVRGLYLLAFVMMTAKFLFTNALVTETRQGRVRMAETRDQHFFSLLGGYRGVFRQVLRTPTTLYTLGIMLVISICNTTSNTFWSILVTKKLLIPAQFISLYPFARSTIMILFFFFVVPRIKHLPFRNPLLISLVAIILGQVVLISLPPKSYLLLLVSTFLEASYAAVASPLLDRMLVLTVDPQERARILAILYMIVITISSPFGWIAGLLSGINRSLPFVMNVGLYSVAALLVFLAARLAKEPVET